MSKIFPKNVAEAIYEATEGKSGTLLALTLHRGARMLHDKRILGKSNEILKALQNIFDKKTGTVRVKITTAKNMESRERKKILFLFLIFCRAKKKAVYLFMRKFLHKPSGCAARQIRRNKPLARCRAAGALYR